MEKLLNTIECPNCHMAIELDDTQYTRIVAQVRTEQFEREVADKIALVKSQQEALQKSAMTEAISQHKQELAEKDQEIARLQEQARSLVESQKQEVDLLNAKAESKRKDDLAEKDREIQELKAKVSEADTMKQLAVTQALQDKNAEIIELKGRITQVQNEAEIREMGLKDVH